MFRLEISTIDSNAEVTFSEPAQLYATLEEANQAAAKAFDEVRNVVTVEVLEVQTH